MIFLELPASLYRRFDKPSAVSIAHMKQRRAATMTSGMEAIRPPTLPARPIYYYKDQTENGTKPEVKHIIVTQYLKSLFKFREYTHHGLQMSPILPL